MADRWGNSGWLYFGGSKITTDGDCSHKIKRRLLLGRRVMTNLDNILKSRNMTLPTKVHLVKAVVLPVVMYRYESWTIKKSWALKNWCFWTMVLEKTLESPLDCKEIKPVYPKGNQYWVFIGRTDADAETPILWPPDSKNWLIWKDPDAGKDWRWEKGTTEDEMVGWHHRLNGHEFQQTLGAGDGQRRLACCSPWGHKELDMIEGLNWTVNNSPQTHHHPTAEFLVVVIVQSLSHIQLFATSWTAAGQASLSLSVSQSLPKFMFIASVMPSSHLILWCPLLLLPSIFLSIRTFPMSRLFASGDQNTRASLASVLPVNIQDWSPLRLTSLISLLSRGLSEVFLRTTVRRHQFFGVLPPLGSSSHNHMWPPGRP